MSLGGFLCSRLLIADFFVAGRTFFNTFQSFECTTSNRIGTMRAREWGRFHYFFIGLDKALPIRKSGLDGQRICLFVFFKR